MADIETGPVKPITGVLLIENLDDIMDDGHAEQVVREFDTKLAQRAMRKVDLMVMPIICLLYLFASLDKSSLGNAKALGMIEDIGGDPDGSRYALLNSLYFVAYAPCMVPLSLLGKRTRVTAVLALSGIYWGVASTCFAAVKEFRGAYALRFLVGLGEAGFAPLTPFYLARWYTRKDLAVRSAYWLMCAPLGGFLNGVIAYGASFIRSHLEPWRVLFLIEGLLTVTLGVIALSILPEDIEKAKWFSAEEKDYLMYQRSMERSVESTHINWVHARGALYRWQQLFPPVLYATLQISGAALSAFLPTFAAEIGFKGALAQISTLAPYGSAVVVMVVMSYFSDRTHNRGWFVASGMWLTILAFGIYLGAPPTMHRARFAALVFAEVGHYISTPLILVWAASNCGSESRRAVTLPLTIAVAQAIAIGSGYLFPRPEGPKYTRGSAVCLALAIFGAIMSHLYQFLLVRENKRRDQLEGPTPAGFMPDTSVDADDANGFRYAT